MPKLAKKNASIEFTRLQKTETDFAAPVTRAAQPLGSLIKSARDIMRKDKGLNGDLDRLPMLTWIMFLKFLDDMEHIREEEAVSSGVNDSSPRLKNRIAGVIGQPMNRASLARN